MKEIKLIRRDGKRRGEIVEKGEGRGKMGKLKN